MEHKYRIRLSSETICHKGVKGMKWGYTDGEPNGKRTAKVIEDGNKTTIIEDHDGWFDETIRRKKEMSVNFGDKKGGDTVRYETIIRRGKISRAVESGKKKIKNFFKSGKKSISKVSKSAISKGKKKIASILKKLK